MGTLRDEVYENLDYLSQLSEVVIGPQNELLGEIPDHIELDFDMVFASLTPYYGSSRLMYRVDLVRILQHYVPYKKWSMIADIKEHFAFEVSPGFSLDPKSKTMTGTAAIVKKSHQMDERKILQLAVNASGRQLSSTSWPTKGLKVRARTILDLLEQGRGTEWLSQLEGRVAGQASIAIRNLLSEVILENKWRVRDAKIIVKMGTWINSYMAEREHELGLVNLMKLKIMLDKDLPVYSIDEVKKDA